MIRTFIAVDLSREVRDSLAGEITRLARILPSARWVNPEGMHLTLAFLGELVDAQLSDTTAATIEAARQSSPFTLRLEGLGTFGGPRTPRVLWVGAGGDVTQLLALQRNLASALEARGFPREERAFSPHLTLARIKGPLPQAELAKLPQALATAIPSLTWPVNEALVMKSELARPGARYTALQHIPLGSR
ncbi:MAG TPA: RNA 2',3'-cyclic phosphodiesterase [Ktedonobacterales bacterium]